MKLSLIKINYLKRSNNIDIVLLKRDLIPVIGIETWSFFSLMVFLRFPCEFVDILELIVSLYKKVRYFRYMNMYFLVVIAQ